MNIAKIALAGFALCLLNPSISLAQASLRDQMGDSIYIAVDQSGESSCHISAAALKKVASDSVQSLCGLNAAPAPENTTARLYITVLWAQGMSPITGQPMNVCGGSMTTQFGVRQLANEMYDTDRYPADKAVFRRFNSSLVAFVHQLDPAGREMNQRFAVSNIADEVKEFCP